MKLINNILEKIKSIKKTTWVKIILVSVFLMMLVLNLLTPLIADDYSYSFIFGDTKRIKNIVDVIISQSNHYMIWGGRSIAHSFAQIFLMFPKFIFSICNSLMYTLFIYLIYRLGKGNSKNDKPSLLIGIHLMIYFITPVFGQTCLWLIGSCNYMWTTCIILLLISQFVLNGNKHDSLLRIISIFILGIISGWTNENTAFGLIIILSGILIIDKINKVKILKWKISGLIGSILGFCIMIAAPGNYVRNAEFVDNDFIIIKWVKRIISYTIDFKNYCLPLLIILVILFSIYIYNHKKINNIIYTYIAGSFFAIYSMVLAPGFPERSWFGVITFLTIATIMLLFDLDNINKIFKPIINDILIIGLFLFFIDYVNLAEDIYGLNYVWKTRIEIIQNYKEEGPIILYDYCSTNHKNPNYGLADIVDKKDEWPNKEVAQYYGVSEQGIVKYNPSK